MLRDCALTPPPRELRAPGDPSLSPRYPGPGRDCLAAGPLVPVSCGWHCRGQGGRPPSQCLGSCMAHLRGLHCPLPSPRECLFISVSMAVPWEPGLSLLGCNFPLCCLSSCYPAALHCAQAGAGGPGLPMSPKGWGAVDNPHSCAWGFPASFLLATQRPGTAALFFPQPPPSEASPLPAGPSSIPTPPGALDSPPPQPSLRLALDQWAWLESNVAVWAWAGERCDFQLALALPGGCRRRCEGGVPRGGGGQRCVQCQQRQFHTYLVSKSRSH